MIPYASIISYAALAAACAWAGWTAQGWRMNERIAALQTEYATAQVRAVERAHSETIRLQEKADAAAQQSAARQAKMADDASHARATADGLRGDLATLLMSSNTEPSSDYKTVSELLARCGERYTSMAREADQRASEVIQLLDAWPTNVPQSVPQSRGNTPTATN